MLYIRKTILLLLIFTSGYVSADVTPMPSPNTKGDIGLIIVASHTPEYIDEWLHTPASHGVTIKRLKKAKPNQLIVSSFLVSGVTPDKDGKYSFSVSFYILDPNNKAIFGKRDYAKGKGTVPENPSFIMANPAFDIILEPSDPAGTYTIVAQVIDLISGKKTDDTYNIEFIKNGL